MELELFYSTGATAGPYLTLQRAMIVAVERLKATTEMDWVSIRVRGTEVMRVEWGNNSRMVAVADEDALSTLVEAA